jgi:hypothetical protein
MLKSHRASARARLKTPSLHEKSLFKDKEFELEAEAYSDSFKMGWQ